MGVGAAKSAGSLWNLMGQGASGGGFVLAVEGAGSIAMSGAMSVAEVADLAASTLAGGIAYADALNGGGFKGDSKTDVDWTDHGHKHFPDKNKSWKDIVKSTKDGPAKYSKDIPDIEAFERNAWETGTPTTNGKNWKVKAYDEVIGATGGKETRYIRIENSANTIHGHPISESEYLKLLR